MQSGKIYDAMKYVVPLTLGQVPQTEIRKPGSENKERIVIDAKYDTETGLLLSQRDPSATIM